MQAKSLCLGLILFASSANNLYADDLGNFIAHLAPKDPTPIALKPIAKLQEAAISAISFVGKPYFGGGTNPDDGFDCSGLVQYVLMQSGLRKLPRTSRDMYEASSPVEVEHMVVGDLVFFDTNNAKQVNHVGIYVGEGRFIHAPSTGNTIRLDKLAQNYWQKTFIGARRVLKLE
jgi:cell wall-associated NlpC family hydrolase